MRYRLECLIGIALLLSLSGATRAATFTDNFDAPRDYLTEGTDGTGWDGFIGRGPGQTVSALNASQDRPGELYLASAGGYWPGDILGPFLYKVVAGDFVATVRVTNYVTVAYNYCGLMARVANLDDAGAGEDWVSIDYFPQYTVGNIAHYADNGTRYETAGGANRATPHAYLQLERTGNTFYLRTSTDGVNWVDYPDTAYSPLTRDDMAGLPVQVGIWQATFTDNLGDVAFDDFTLSGAGVVVANRAYNARPVNNTTEVPRDVVLNWTPTEGAVAHDVYFGAVQADVAAADRTSPLYVGKAQEPNVYDVGRLEFGQTYYWRVDEIGADGVIMDQGDVWTFTVEPVSYPISGVTATASSMTTNYGPEKTVDGSGLNANDQHSLLAADMWLSLKGGPQPTWIQYEFDKPYKLDKMIVWNQNQAMEAMFGLGAKDVTVQYSVDGEDWTDVGDFVFEQGTSLDTYTANTTVPLGSVLAQYIKLTVNSNWGGIIPQYGLSEVRFFSIPVWAREPHPDPNATGVHPQVTLSWRAGREAGSHNVYLGTDPNAVADGTAPMVTTSEPQYEVAAELEQAYYWKVVEVNETETPSAWTSDVWSFSTAAYVTVDDFESYTNDSPNRLFQTWIDGAGFSADEFFPNGNTGNGTGALVGYDPMAGDIMETTIVHGGRQSMPLEYGHESQKTSETDRTFDPAQDWTKHGITTLVLYFRGSADNDAAPVYVKINGTKVAYNNGAPSSNVTVWRQWNIDLASSGASLNSVKTLTIGVGDGSTSAAGTIFVDDLRLYATPPQVPVPTDPGTTGLVALYAMEGNVRDSIGSLHGTPSGDPGYGNSMPGFGQALGFDGVNDYVDLPVAPLLSTLTSATFAVWVDVYNSGDAWQRVFDFGTGTTNYMFLTPYTGGQSARFAIRTAAIGEQLVTAPRALMTGWHHLAVVIDGDAMTLRLYEDGTAVDTDTTSLLPSDLETTTNNWLGRSQFGDTDPYFAGSLDDLRIFNRALSEDEVLYLAGDR